MLQVQNRTPFVAQLNLLPDANGVDTVFGILKATFSLGAVVRVSDEQVPVTLADEYYGEPATSSIRVPSDVSLGKPATDVVLIGSAWSPGDSAWHTEVALSVGPV